MRKMIIGIVRHPVSAVTISVLVVILTLAITWLAAGQRLVSQWHGSTIPVSTASIATTPPMSLAGQGVAFGIKDAQNAPFWRTYRVSLDAPFHGILQVTNHQPAQSFLLTCVLDYQQVPCRYGGQPQVLNRIAMGTNEQRDIPFETPTLSQGWHDFTLLIVPSPDDHSLNPRFRLGTDTVYAARSVLLDGGLSWGPPVITYPDVGQSSPNPALPLDGIFVDQEAHPGQLQAWTSQGVSAGETVHYYVHLGNKSRATYTFALLAFLDYQQIPLDGQRGRAVFGSLAAGAQGVVPGQVMAPAASGVHELMVLWVENPYHALEYPPDGPTRQFSKTPVRVESSLRVALAVATP
ncbi:MAG: hypothetical protein ACR2PL_01465 [Dehalococcoidia bacterium]